MNQRIRQLYERSDVVRKEICHFTGTSYVVQEFDPQTFAELIIKECAGIAHGSDMPSKDIKEYFGIKS